MKKSKQVELYNYILKLCRQVLDDNIAIDDDARKMLSNILKTGDLKIANKHSNGVDYLIDFIMHYESIECPGMGEDLINCVLSLKNKA